MFFMPFINLLIIISILIQIEDILNHYLIYHLLPKCKLAKPVGRK